MIRRKNFKKRNATPDPIYNSILLQMVINQLTKKGKKHLAFKLINQTLQQIEQKTKEDPLQILEKGILNVTPIFEIKSRRIGGSVYPTPVELIPERGNSIGIRWILNACRGKSGKRFIVKLTNEFIESSKKMGSAMRKKNEIQKIAESNARVL